MEAFPFHVLTFFSPPSSIQGHCNANVSLGSSFLWATTFLQVSIPSVGASLSLPSSFQTMHPWACPMRTLHPRGVSDWFRNDHVPKAMEYTDNFYRTIGKKGLPLGVAHLKRLPEEKKPTRRKDKLKEEEGE